LTTYKALLASELGRALNTSDILERNNLTPDPWAAEVLSLKHKRLLLNIHRQGSKSTTACAAACQIAALNENATVIFVSPSQRQSQENIRRCTDLIEGAGYRNEIASPKQLEIEFKNRSRIFGLPGKPETIRGFSNVAALIVDEAAYCDDEIFPAVLPFLATNPKALFIAMSTPNGARGWFYHQWADGIHWKKIKVTASECPRISADYLEEMKATLGANKFAQEFQCSFVSDGAAFITAEIFDACVIPNAGLM